MLARRFLRAARGPTCTFILWLLLTSPLGAQELVRTSDRGLAIASFQRSPEAFFYFGPFQEELSGTANVQYTDNVNLTATDKISDLSFTQALNLNTTWVISHLNQLQFTFGGQIIEHFYGNGRNELDFAIAPNSKIELKLEAGDFKFRFYDQFSYEQNPTQDPTATNTANLNSLTNTIGAAVESDLNIALLSLSADYSYNNQSGQTAGGQNNSSTTGTRETFRVSPSLTFRLSPAILYGLSVVATRSSGSDTSNVNTLNFGPFINGQLSKHLEFDLAAGGTILDTKPAMPPGYYYNATLRYQLTRRLQLIFAGSHDLIFTTGTGLTEENVFKVGTQLNLTRSITFSASPFVNFGDVKTTGLANINVADQGNYTQFGLDASLGWRPRKRWATSLIYNFIRRESGATFGTGTTASQNYIQNTLSLQVGYSF